MLFKSVVLLLFILFDVYCANSDILFSSGWYKTRNRGEKLFLHNVKSIGPELMPANISYLKIAAVMPTLPTGAISGLENLKDLTITSCGIIEIQPGAFQDVTHLSKLNLKENAIKRIKKGVFNSLNITQLFLNKNDISFIDSNAFDDMPNLVKIKLNFNQISIWDSSWFKSTPLLRTVLMRRNSIEEIPENALRNFVTKGNATDGKKLPDLKIFLSKNKITKIHPQAFRGIRKIGQLFLDRNNLTVLDKNTFTGLEHIHLLNLARNNFSAIPKDIFLTVKSIRQLDLSANHRLHCVPIQSISVVQLLSLENINNLNCTCIEELSKHTKVITDSESACTVKGKRTL